MRERDRVMLDKLNAEVSGVLAIAMAAAGVLTGDWHFAIPFAILNLAVWVSAYDMWRIMREHRRMTGHLHRD